MNDKKIKDNIVLIGMPAVGKSTVGVIAAKEMGYEFVDADLLIQKRENRLLREIIAAEGVDGFIKIEGEVNSSINCHHSIISTGGSVIYEENAMKHLKEIGTIVYLSLSFEELNRRLSNLKGRGVVLRNGQDLMDLYKERTPLYEKYADITINEDGLDIEKTLERLMDALNKNN